MESEKDWLRSGSLSFLIWKDHAEILTPVVTKIWSCPSKPTHIKFMEEYK